MNNYQQCTWEIPVLQGNKQRFLHPTTWVLQDVATIIPCSPLTPVRWKIRGKWFCSYPEIKACEEPVEFSSAEFPTLSKDRDVFSAQELEDHHELYRVISIKDSIQAWIALLATGYPVRVKEPVEILLTPRQIRTLEAGMGAVLFPMYNIIGGGEGWTIFCTFFLIFVVLKAAAGCLLRMCITCSHRGCGWWLIPSIWGTLWSILDIPRHVFKGANRVSGAVVQDFNKMQDNMDRGTCERPCCNPNETPAAGPNESLLNPGYENHYNPVQKALDEMKKLSGKFKTKTPENQEEEGIPSASAPSATSP